MTHAMQEVEKSNRLIAEFMGFPKPRVGDTVYYNRSLCNSPYKLTISEVTARHLRFNEEMAFDRYGIEYFDGIIMKPDDLRVDSHFPARPYDWSWDWLMPVVEKIESIGYSVFIQNECSWIKVARAGMRMPDLSELGETKIESTYNVIIQFITWFNLKQK